MDIKKIIYDDLYISAATIIAWKTMNVVSQTAVSLLPGPNWIVFDFGRNKVLLCANATNIWATVHDILHYVELFVLKYVL